MNRISRNEFTSLIDGATLLEGSSREPKVYETPDGRIVKLFRVKHWLSSNLLCPHALRFARNASRLAAAGFPSLQVERVAKVTHLKRQMVVYTRLPGMSLRHALRNTEPREAERLMRAAGEFVADVHERGVYFRSMHFGNVLVAEDGVFALIDILDLKVLRSPLGPARRRRNFKHMIRYEEDRLQMREQWSAFCEGYRARAARKGRLGTVEIAALLDEWRRQLG